MISRARPLLGTIVSIRTDATEDAVSRAFAAVQRVHGLMSAHSIAGDLAEINREAHRRPVAVDPWTFEVLSRAVEVSAASDGAFDVTLGHAGASFRDVELLDGHRVRLRREARLDLGGIAKGFAVDRAVDVLRYSGATCGSVNAGGDLRIFGGSPQTVRVRLPCDPQLSVALPEVREQAFATSASYFGADLTDPRTGRPMGLQASVTVSAASCIVADALTKAVAALGPLPALLERFAARAFLVDREGNLYAARA